MARALRTMQAAGIALLFAGGIVMAGDGSDPAGDPMETYVFSAGNDQGEAVIDPLEDYIGLRAGGYEAPLLGGSRTLRDTTAFDARALFPAK